MFTLLINKFQVLQFFIFKIYPFYTHTQTHSTLMRKFKFFLLHHIYLKLKFIVILFFLLNPDFISDLSEFVFDFPNLPILSNHVDIAISQLLMYSMNIYISYKYTSKRKFGLYSQKKGEYRFMLDFTNKIIFK